MLAASSCEHHSQSLSAFRELQVLSRLAEQPISLAHFAKDLRLSCRPEASRRAASRNASRLRTSMMCSRRERSPFGRSYLSGPRDAPDIKAPRRKSKSVCAVLLAGRQQRKLLTKCRMLSNSRPRTKFAIHVREIGSQYPSLSTEYGTPACLQPKTLFGPSTHSGIPRNPFAQERPASPTTLFEDRLAWILGGVSG